MLANYHKLIYISLQKYDQFIFEGVIALFEFSIIKFEWITPFILIGISSKLCMFAYYHIQICVLLWHFDLPIFRRVIALFGKEYFTKRL